MQAAESDASTRILLVEDEAIIAQNLKRRLEKLGYHVAGIADSGDEALALAVDIQPSLVFMDIIIQGPKDGISTAVEMTRRLDVPIVFLTAHTDAATIQRAKSALPYGYLVKPFEERELHTTIEVALFRHRTDARTRLLDHAIESATTGIAMIDARHPGRAIVRCNPAFEAITGHTKDEIVGRSAWFLEGRDTDRDASREFRQTLADLGGCMTTLVLHRKDGGPFWCELAVSAVHNSIGEVTHLLMFCTDVSARKDMEGALLHAQKMQAFGQLAGGVAHDFNNILSVMLGYSELVLEDLAHDDPNRGLLGVISRAGHRAAGLTRQLLAFSRRQVMQRKVVDVNALVRELEKMLSRVLPKDIALQVTTDPDLGRVKADSGQLEQVLMNLVVNAQDAMPAGGTITVETANVNLTHDSVQLPAGCKPGRFVTLSVTDTGTGMDQETQARIFEPYFTTKGEGKGTGLGLATVNGIVAQSDGRITVTSQPGEGCTFRVYLPRYDAEDEARPLPSLPAAPVRSATILVVEDEDDIRQLLCSILEKCGHEVLQARSAKEACLLAEQRSGPVHLLLTDVVAPGLDGRELARRLSARFPGLRLILMSGGTGDEVVQDRILDSGVPFLEKPFSVQSLTDTVAAVLAQPPPPA